MVYTLLNKIKTLRDSKIYDDRIIPIGGEINECIRYFHGITYTSYPGKSYYDGKLNTMIVITTIIKKLSEYIKKIRVISIIPTIIMYYDVILNIYENLLYIILYISNCTHAENVNKSQCSNVNMDDFIKNNLSASAEKYLKPDSEKEEYLDDLNNFLGEIQEGIIKQLRFSFSQIVRYNQYSPKIKSTSQSTVSNILNPFSWVRGGDKKLRYTYKNKRKTRKPRKSKPTRKPRSPRKKFYYY